MGTISPESLAPAERNEATDVLAEFYVRAPDGGTHAAAGWALRQWKQPLPAIETRSRPPAGRLWFVNGQGMTMVEVAAGKFTMGTDTGGEDNEKPAHEVALTRPWYLGDREVTVEQFQRFIDDEEYAAAEKPVGWQGSFQQYSPTPDCPMSHVNWFDAVLYCNWLSAQEGRKPSYHRTGAKEKLRDHDDNEQEYDVWRCDFMADGYRLPTEAEWEFAARAGSAAGFCFGDGRTRLLDYAWFLNNSDVVFNRSDLLLNHSNTHSWPCGQKLPNALGLFDMHGNVLEWCWDWYGSYSADPVSDPTGPATGSGRVLRGGASYDIAFNCRSAYRFGRRPMRRHYSSGIRVSCVR
ncbi:MAG TPA: SUMF1/EgtB/PvdO family nonheme iron enzyme [Pirellulales bacterium]|jgi:formylglycine-generating enzyme required for sulfatase activity|nr:SUMF1/EgtB/PvdO family nonheme iron enzyme [Pirellulales bacterium]